ncbi:MAG: hypothetical protein ISS63_12630 [Desulfobacteraceae bacterium]|nr:hypothetical protein [Desulfobacteraceae bacterium]
MLDTGYLILVVAKRKSRLQRECWSKIPSSAGMLNGRILKLIPAIPLQRDNPQLATRNSQLATRNP